MLLLSRLPMPCPSESTLLALVEGGLHDVPHVLEAHLDRCETCRSLVVALAGTSESTRDDRYVVRGECGRGGQSRVLRVYDRHMKREVALKEFLEAGPGQVSAVDRCLREIWAAGAVSHPAVLPPHELGIGRDGAAYYTMPLVEGRTLAKVVEAAPRLADRLRLIPNVIQVAQALASAHARGLVHRDVKPSNVMVGDFGETRVLDWGLARAVASETRSFERDTEEMGSTREGTILGTPVYMSPEQAEGRSDLIGPRSDVWSLGALLFFVLVGEPPFLGASTDAVLDAVREGRRAPLRAADGEVPAELVAIVDRAMSLDPEDRYPEGGAFADDLAAFLAGARVQAYAYRASDRIVRFARRNRALLVGFSAVCSVLALGLASTSVLWRREALARSRADDALALAQSAHEAARRAALRAEQEATSAARRLAIAEIETAERLREDGRILRSEEMAARAMRDDPGPDAAIPSPEGDEGVTARARGMLLLRQLDSVLREDPQMASPREDPALGVAVSDRWWVKADGRAEVLLRDRVHATERVLGGHADALDVALSSDGRFAATRDREDAVRVWSLPEGELMATWGSTSPRYVSIAVADTGAVAFIDPQQRVRIAFPLTPGAAPRRLTIERPYSLQFEPGGDRLAVGTTDGRVVLTTVRGAVQAVWAGVEPAVVGRLAFSKDGSALAAGLVDGHLLAGPTGAGQPVYRTKGPNGSASVLAWSADASTVFAAGLDGRVRGHALGTGEPAFALDAPASVSLAIEAPAGRLVLHDAWASHAWTLATRKQTHALPSGSRARVSAWMGDALWVAQSGRATLHRADHPAAQSIDLGAVAPLMNLLVDQHGVRWTLHTDGVVGRWIVDAEGEWTQTHAWTEAEAPGVALAVCHASGFVATHRGAGEIAIWRVGDAKARTLAGHRQPVTSLACSRDGRTLISSDFGGRVLRWRLQHETPQPEPLSRFDGVVFQVAFIPGTDALVVAGQAGLWAWSDALASTPVAARWSSRPHHQVGVSSDRIAALRQDGSVALYRDDGELWAEFRNLGGREVHAVALSPEGTTLVLMNAARVWSVDLTP